MTTNVEMVADEVCCWLPHAMFVNRVSSRGTCFALPTNTQMRSRVTRPTTRYKASRKQSQPLLDVTTRRQEGGSKALCRGKER